MKLIRNDLQRVELRGRRRRKGEAGAGFWVVWVVACVFLGAAALIWFVLAEGTSDRFWAVPVGVFGMTILLVGLAASLERERLVLDLWQKRGEYSTWSPWQGRRVERRFAFDQIDSLVIRKLTAAVSAPPGSGVRHGSAFPWVYEKWELRLRVRPRTVIPILRSGNERRVREMGRAISESLGVELKA